MLAGVDRFTEDFKREHGFDLALRKPAKVALSKSPSRKTARFGQSAKRNSAITSTGSALFPSDRKKEFVIEKKTVDDPDKELSRWVVDSLV